MTGNQLLVADVSNNGSISSFDAAEVANYVVSGTPVGMTGTWKFVPVNRSYASVTSNEIGQDFSALLMGEVSGNWNNTGARPVGDAEKSIAIDVPHLVTLTNSEVIVPISIKGAGEKGIISYEFDLRYDPSVIQPQENPVDVTGTVSRRLMTVANPYEPGLLRVVVYGPIPIDADGILLNLRFTVVGATDSASPLTIERIMFNDIDAIDSVTNGEIRLSSASE